MNEITSQLSSLLHRRSSALPVAAGPVESQRTATQSSSGTELASFVVHSAETVRRDFADLTAIPSMVRARVAQAAAAARSTRDEVERLVAAVEADLAAQLASAQSLYASLQGLGSEVVGESASASDLTSETGPLRTLVVNGAVGTLLSDAAAKQVAVELAKLTPASSDPGTGVTDGGASKT